MMKKKQLTAYRLSNEEIALFRNAVTGARPLKSHNKATSNHKNVKQKIIRQKIKPLDFSFTDIFPTTVAANTILSYVKPGADKQILSQIRQDKFIADAILDLHSKTIPQARQAVSDFLAAAEQQHFQCVRIIHGKGHSNTDTDIPLLKNYVNGWLPQHPLVLAFHSASPRYGGTGAVIVLLNPH